MKKISFKLNKGMFRKIFNREIFHTKWLKRLDRYIIVKFLGTYFFAIALILSLIHI